MCSYNRINRTYASEHPWLLTDVLRKEWGFQGYVMSDWGAVNNRVSGLAAGLDLEMPSSNGENDAPLVQAVKDGILDESILDQAVERILGILFAYYNNRTDQELTLKKDYETARRIAEESMVLLKNDAVLPFCQNRLIEEILKVQPNTTVVLHNGSPVELPWLSKVKGILEAYLGGQAGGTAVANLLYEKANPCGKLAETFPVKLSGTPSYLNFGGAEHVEYKEGIFIGYRYYNTKEMEVAFSFGHGLSYTDFSYNNLAGSNERPMDVDLITVSVDVTNTGTIPGKEIVQLYIKDLTGSAVRPEKELKGFAKVALLPGETKTVTIELDKRSFAWYHTGLKDWYAASGSYEILIGASFRDIRLSRLLCYQRGQPIPGYPLLILPHFSMICFTK